MQFIGSLLVLIVVLKIVLLIKNRWQRQQNEKQQLQLINNHWQQKQFLPDQPILPQKWNGFRVFTIAKKKYETDDIISFYLEPHDGKPLPIFHAGQYLMLHIKHPEQDKLLTRCYSLSDCHSEHYYRISVKKEPQGLVSNYLQQEVYVGDTIEATAPTGVFYLNIESSSPLVLIAGGVGITPLLSMINILYRTQDTREIHLFYGVSNGSHVMKKAYLKTLDKNLPHFHLHLCYSRPEPDDSDYQHKGRITAELLQSILPNHNYHYYLCASLEMMKDLTEQLKNWGVPESDVFFESFGTSNKPNIMIQETDKTYPVFFKKSNKLMDWSVEEGSLLEFAEKNAIAIESSCRSGQCGLCKTKVSDGSVEYVTEPGVVIDEGYCLSCISIPKDSLTVEL